MNTKRPIKPAIRPYFNNLCQNRVIKSSNEFCNALYNYHEFAIFPLGREPNSIAATRQYLNFIAIKIFVRIAVKNFGLSVFNLIIQNNSQLQIQSNALDPFLVDNPTEVA